MLIEVRKEVRSILSAVTGGEKSFLGSGGWGVGGDQSFTTSGRNRSYKPDSLLKLSFFDVSADGDVEML